MEIDAKRVSQPSLDYCAAQPLTESEHADAVILAGKMMRLCTSSVDGNGRHFTKNIQMLRSAVAMLVIAFDNAEKELANADQK